MDENTQGRKKRKKASHVEIIRHGRDEMNLVEYPFASLWKNTEPGAEIIHEWETQHPVTGKTVQAFWRVTGDSELGLPTTRDEQLYLVLMELTQEAHMEDQTIYFTRHGLLKRLGWAHNETGYQLLEQAFTRLGAVFITSKNAFWDGKARSFATVGFSLIDNFKIFNEKAGRRKAEQSELPLSFFKWNDVLFQSFQSGYIRAIDLDFALSLQSSLALRLYRYLDKKSYQGRRTFEIELSALCERHLGMRPNPYPSKYKERLASAHEELITRGFLESVRYETMNTKKAEKVCYAFAPRQNQKVALMPKTLDGTDQNMKLASEHLPDPQESSELMRQILALGVTSDVARELMEKVSGEKLRLQLECLAERDPKDSAATFVKAVREEWAPPTKHTQRKNAEKHEKERRASQEAENQKKAQEEAFKRQQMAMHETEAAQLDEIFEEMDEETRTAIEIETRDRLGVLFQEGKNSAAFAAQRRQVQREQRNENTT